MATRCIPLSCHVSQDLVKPSFLQPGRQLLATVHLWRVCAVTHTESSTAVLGKRLGLRDTLVLRPPWWS